MNNLDKEIKKQRNLVQNKDKTEDELSSIAKESLNRQEIVGSLTFCLEGEKSFALSLLNRYLSESSLETSSEKDTLTHLIDLEVLLNRVKTQLNNEYSKANPTIPIAFLQQVTELTNQITDLKTKLGLSKQKEQKDVLQEWENLKAKALAYYKEHAGCNVVRCPECKKLFYILKDMKGHTVEKMPFFRKTLLYNRPLFEMYDQHRLTLEEMTTILGVSVEYIIYIYENEYKNEKKQTN